MVLLTFLKYNFIYFMLTWNYFSKSWAYIKDIFKSWEWFYGEGEEKSVYIKIGKEDVY